MNKEILIARYTALKERVAKCCFVNGRNPEDVRIIVVTKTHPLETVQMVVDAGIRDLGENRVQEIEQKVPLLKGTFDMHLIGHLQTNKVNKVAQLTNWIQSVDSIRLAEKINTTAELLQKRINVMVQVNTSHEDSKSGCDESECIELAARVAECSNLDFRGLMTIGPLGASEVDTRKSFAILRKLAEQCAAFSSLKIELSMGMSSDFEIAIEEGSTLVRLGTAMFGARVTP